MHQILSLLANESAPNFLIETYKDSQSLEVPQVYEKWGIPQNRWEWRVGVWAPPTLQAAFAETQCYTSILFLTLLQNLI